MPTGGLNIFTGRVYKPILYRSPQNPRRLTEFLASDYGKILLLRGKLKNDEGSLFQLTLQNRHYFNCKVLVSSTAQAGIWCRALRLGSGPFSLERSGQGRNVFDVIVITKCEWFSQSTLVSDVNSLRSLYTGVAFDAIVNSRPSREKQEKQALDKKRFLPKLS